MLGSIFSGPPSGVLILAADSRPGLGLAPMGRNAVILEHAHIAGGIAKQRRILLRHGTLLAQRESSLFISDQSSAISGPKIVMGYRPRRRGHRCVLKWCRGR